MPEDNEPWFVLPKDTTFAWREPQPDDFCPKCKQILRFNECICAENDNARR